MFLKEMRAGKGYVHRHLDVVGRPVIVAIARRHNVFDRSLLESSRMCTWMLETAMKQCDTLEPPPPGKKPQAAATAKPEQALGIFDLRDFSPLQADLEVAGFLIEVLYNYYPGRTGKVLLVGAPDLFRTFWENIKPLLGRYSSLADFVSVEELRENYFKPGLEPPEFAPASGRQVVRGAWASGQPRGSASQAATVGAFAGASVVAWGLYCRCQVFRKARSVAHGSPVGLGTRHIENEVQVDAETAEIHIRQLQRHIPDGFKFRGRPASQNRALLWWFLRDRHSDVAEAAAKLCKCLQWRKDFGVERLGPELFIKEMRARKAYLHAHRDISGRPVLVVIARRHNILERRFKESCSMCTWYMEQLLDRLQTLEPSSPSSEDAQVEQALAIVDLSGFTPLQADLEFVCFMIDVIHNYYPRRLARILLVDAPDLFETFWKSVCPLLHHYKDSSDGRLSLAQAKLCQARDEDYGIIATSNPRVCELAGPSRVHNRARGTCVHVTVRRRSGGPQSANHETQSPRGGPPLLLLS